MNLISFESDYTTGAHPKILENLTKTNFEALSGYGSDKYSSSAKQKIKAACENDDIEVSFLVGGTQTNQQFVVLDKKSYEALQKKVKIGFWENLSDGRVVVRFATSWSTADSDIEYLKEIL